MKDLKSVYQADTEDLVLSALDDLEEKWGKKYLSSVSFLAQQLAAVINPFQISARDLEGSIHNKFY